MQGARGRTRDLDWFEVIIVIPPGHTLHKLAYILMTLLGRMRNVVRL